MKYCDQCGTKLNDNARFCSSCGARFSVADEGALSIKQECTGLQSTDNQPSDDIGEYLKWCVMLEKNAYTQSQVIARLKKKRDSLGHHNVYEQPDAPDRATLDDDARDIKGNFQLAGFGALIGGIIGLFAGSIMWGAVIGGGILLGGVYIAQAVENSRYNNAVEGQYQRELQNYQSLVSEDKARVERELKEKARLNATIAEMETKNAEIAKTLARLYDVDVLFPKYRNLVAVCSLYEYFISGRFTSLTGPDGAYNRYETEVRLDRIITKLDKIISQLDDIKANQYMLWDALQEGNRLTQKLVDESVKQSRLAERTAENTALAAHHAQIAANNAEACAWIGIANYAELRKANK